MGNVTRWALMALISINFCKGAGPCDVVSELNRGPRVLPMAPPMAPPERVPVAPPVPHRPEPTPQPPTRPEPPSPHRPVPVPAPAPHEPTRRIPAQPVEDPKDIQPEDLYSTDTRVSHFWNNMPVGLRRIMVDGARAERAELEAQLRASYQTTDPMELTRIGYRLMAEIEGIEAQHRPSILEIIRRMISDHYGAAVASNLQMDITQNNPTASGHSGSAVTIPELPLNLDNGMIYRTEMRNIWQQGEGWLGGREFAYVYANELNAISPGLAERYQNLDRLFRFVQLAQVGMMQTASELDGIPREAIGAGREIVTTDFEIVAGADGSQNIHLRSVSGVSAGRNGWAAALEAAKAASQMATPMEGAFRWMLSASRREALNQATNSVRAEIRQGVFGPVVVRELRRRLATLHNSNSPLNEADYRQTIDGLFSMHPGAFQDAMRLIFNSDFQTNGETRRLARELLMENGVITR